MAHGRKKKLRVSLGKRKNRESSVRRRRKLRRVGFLKNKRIEKEEAKLARETNENFKNVPKQGKKDREKTIGAIVIESHEGIEGASITEVVEVNPVHKRGGRKIVVPQRFRK
ncbi:hypothetical protein K469DRAFT_717623 [Zopfia rhizophila CBS 207.26]|uniref:Uncharacterized protein n=1 Tax=Zopfia rhizophila CBS 207.26 TaxID=1314779 RepID=A0A6A6DJL5_9PEZI|nr:hypothetical protein K469DRAFT_717623 [Zopfia rhizophila CBS 207.26]